MLLYYDALSVQIESALVTFVNKEIFKDKIFIGTPKTMKSTKILVLENFRLYGNCMRLFSILVNYLMMLKKILMHELEY